MNKVLQFARLLAVLVVVLTAAMPAWAQLAANPKNSRGEQFFIISSVDMQKHQLVLMLPTQLTLIATVDDHTTLLGENGKKLALKDLRAGATVWAITRPKGRGKVLALRIREGAMTPAELHKLYLDPTINPADFARLPKPNARPRSASPENTNPRPAPRPRLMNHPHRRPHGSRLRQTP